MKLAVFLVLALAAVASAVDWSPVDRVLQEQIREGAFPGCVAIVANQVIHSAYSSSYWAQDILYAKAFGTFTYGDPAPFSGSNPEMTMDTVFDMASCTKVLSTF